MMSKQTLGGGCAMMILLGLWSTDQLGAQETASASSSTSSSSRVSASAIVKRSVPAVTIGMYSTGLFSPEPAERRIDALLDQRLKSPLRYERERLNVILRAIKQEYDLPVVFDKSALDEVAISPESKVTSHLQNISLRSALNHLLKEPGLEDLTYMIDNEMLVITTEERANETLVTRVYPVDDVVGTPQGEPAWPEYDPLIDAIVATVEHDSWMENGTGEGEIVPVNRGMLVITQSRHVHRKIRRLLADLRETLARIESRSVSHR